MPKVSREEHYWLIELLAYWEGGVNSSHLSQQFGVTRAQSKKYLSQYQQRHPSILTYNSSVKAFVLAENSQYQHINGDVSEYLDWLDQHSTNLTAFHQSLLTNTTLSLPKSTVAPEIMRALVGAMKQKRGVDIDYVSMTNPQGQSRIIYPHTFVKTGLRWHLRGYCELRGGYADFVLSRFRGSPEIDDSRSPHGMEDDHDWNKNVSLVFKPNPQLSSPQQAIITHDYQMIAGELRMDCRAALVNYLLLAMQVNIKDQNSKPEAQPLILVNSENILPYLFDSPATEMTQTGKQS
ncbi:WYL domain-containing protein [Alteromonadaceae bacterium BrNp21-10]|nr:WYL domain-containing protein [Alteromonadaceae bacterium BrNp21-10]